MTMLPDSNWILHPARTPAARCRLFCLPYAGSGATQFLAWPALLPDSVEVCAFQLPGRESRFREAPFRLAQVAAEEIGRQMEPWLDLPYALFGHSMGALLSFEVARALRRAGGPLPFLMLLSAYFAPQFSRPQAPVRDLAPDLLIERLREMGGTPEAVLDNRELMDFLLPAVRADFAICETWACAPEPPLPVPMIVFGGMEDAEVGATELEGWRAHTAAGFRREMLPGGHFFLNSSRERLAGLIAAALRSHCPGTAGPG